MIQFVRSLFGLNGSSSNRKAIGSTTGFDPQEVNYIKDSNKRLNLLLDLQKKYKGTPHEAKLKLVLEKTKKIHWFLVSKKRVNELELFHIRNTDNFISTYALIIDVHQRHKENAFHALEVEAKPVEVQKPVVQAPLPPVEQATNGNRGELFEIAEKVKQRNKQTSSVHALAVGTEIPRLAIPEVFINTVAKVFYQKENLPGKQVAHEISFVSTQQEKDAFQSYIAERIGMKDIYYVGNAIIKQPDSRSSALEETVPIFYLRNYLYALTMHDFRIFPVKIYRNNPYLSNAV
jgi:hypothetical protein